MTGSGTRNQSAVVSENFRVEPLNNQSEHSAQNSDFLTFELGHFDLPNQLCDCIPVVCTYERCDHVDLVSAAASWHVPYSITFRVMAK